MSSRCASSVCDNLGVNVPCRSIPGANRQRFRCFFQRDHTLGMDLHHMDHHLHLLGISVCLHPGWLLSEVGTFFFLINTLCPMCARLWQSCACCFHRNAYGYVYCSPAVLPHGFFVAWCLNLGLNIGWLFLWDRRCNPQTPFSANCHRNNLIIIVIPLQVDGWSSGLPHLSCFDQLRDDILLLSRTPHLRSVAQQIPQSRPVAPPCAGQ